MSYCSKIPEISYLLVDWGWRREGRVGGGGEQKGKKHATTTTMPQTTIIIISSSFTTTTKCCRVPQSFHVLTIHHPMKISNPCSQNWPLWFYEIHSNYSHWSITKSNRGPKNSQSGVWRWPFWSFYRGMFRYTWVNKHTLNLSHANGLYGFTADKPICINTF